MEELTRLTVAEWVKVKENSCAGSVVLVDRASDVAQIIDHIQHTYNHITIYAETVHRDLLELNIAINTMEVIGNCIDFRHNKNIFDIPADLPEYINEKVVTATFDLDLLPPMVRVIYDCKHSIVYRVGRW